VSLRRSLGDLVERLEPIAERLGCRDDLLRVNDILERGTSAVRQREVFGETKDLSAVVDSLVRELKTGVTPLSRGDLVGGTVVHGDPIGGEAS
jgi:carboxylate-amine ligase